MRKRREHLLSSIVELPLGYELPHGCEMPLDQWLVLVRKTGRERSGAQWRLGDLLNYGESRYGEAYEREIETTGLSYQTIANIKSIAAKVELSRRRENLSFAHHAEVASLSPADQDNFLDLAQGRGWSRAELRAEVGKAARRPDPSEGAVARRITQKNFRGSSALPSGMRSGADVLVELPPEDRRSVTEGRAEANTQMSALLALDPSRALDDIARLLKDARARIGQLPKERRVAFVRGIQLACGVTDADLRPIA
jgi:hypothetical protein